MDFEHPSADEVDQLLLNARLRDELEPYLDESFDLFDQRRSFPQRGRKTLHER